MLYQYYITNPHASCGLNNTCLRHLGHALDHQFVRCHGRVLRERQAEDGGHHHLLDQFLSERHGAVLLVVCFSETPARV